MATQHRTPVHLPSRTVATIGAAALMLSIAGSALHPALTVGQTTDLDTIRAYVDEHVEAARTVLASDAFESVTPDSIVAGVDGDPVALRDWVARETDWVPYLGTLRGSDGVLADGSGNSLDRSILLADLLVRAGHDVGLARATLTPELSSALVEGLAGSAAPMSDTDLFPEDLEQHTRVATSAAALAGSIGLPEGAGGSELDELRQAASDHWWVQVVTDDGVLDLDPLLDDPLPTPELTYALDAVPAELRHRVAIRVIIERLHEDGRSTVIPFEYAHDFGLGDAFTSAELSFEPAGGLDLEPVDGIAEVADVMTHWLPVLEIDGRRVLGDWFTNAGIMERAPRLGIAEAIGGGLDALDAIGDGDTAVAPGSVLTGVWLEYEVTSPGQPQRVERRELVDLIGPAARAAGDVALPELSGDVLRDRGLRLLGTTSLLLSPGFASHRTLAAEALQYTVDSRDAAIAIALAAAGSEDERIDGALAQAPLVNLDLLAMSTARQLWNPSAGSTFVAAPNVWSRHDFRSVVDDGVVGNSVVDIVLNGVAVHPRAMADAARIRLEQGVADTLVEHVMGGGVGRSNAFARFEERTDGAPGWTIVRGTDDLDSLVVPDDDRARIRAAVGSGAVAVVGPVQRDERSEWVDWWRVDPVTGATLGIGERGWGSETMSYEELVSRVAAYTRALARSERINRLCTKFQWAQQATAALTVVRQIYAWQSPVPPPIITVCKPGVVL